MVSLAGHTLTSSSGMPLPPSSASRGQPNMLCFSEFPDRLACDPMNCTWVYGMYAFKFDSTEAQAHAHIEALVGHLMARAARHYAEAVIAYRRLGPAERAAHAMHGVLPVSKPVEMPFLFLPRHASPQMNTAAAAAAASSSARRASVSLGSGGAQGSPRGSLSVSSGQPLPGSGRRRGSLSTARATRAAHSLSESEATRLLLKRWPALPQSAEEQVRLWLRQSDAYRGAGGATPANAVPAELPSTTAAGRGRVGNVDPISPEAPTATASALGMSLRVRLVVDIIASRKSLGATEDITESTPYQLGQYVYDYVQRSFSHTTSAATSKQSPEKGRGSGGSVGSAKTRPHSSPMNHNTAAGPTLSPRDVADWLSEDVDAVAGAVLRHIVVTITTVAISDAANKLAGRDVLFPCRGSMSSSGGSGAAASAIAGYHGSQGEMTTTAAAIDHLLSASPAMMLMFPVTGACLSPVQKELLDQNRMVICFPRMASVTK